MNDNPGVSRREFLRTGAVAAAAPRASHAVGLVKLLAVLAAVASIQDGKRVYLAEFDRVHSVE